MKYLKAINILAAILWPLCAVSGDDLNRMEFPASPEAAEEPRPPSPALMPQLPADLAILHQPVTGRWTFKIKDQNAEFMCRILAAVTGQSVTQEGTINTSFSLEFVGATPETIIHETVKKYPITLISRGAGWVMRDVNEPLHTSITVTDVKVAPVVEEALTPAITVDRMTTPAAPTRSEVQLSPQEAARIAKERDAALKERKRMLSTLPSVPSRF